jgi:hypothetical protein
MSEGKVCLHYPRLGASSLSELTQDVGALTTLSNVALQVLARTQNGVAGGANKAPNDFFRVAALSLQHVRLAYGAGEGDEQRSLVLAWKRRDERQPRPPPGASFNKGHVDMVFHPHRWPQAPFLQGAFNLDKDLEQLLHRVHCAHRAMEHVLAFERLSAKHAGPGLQHARCHRPQVSRPVEVLGESPTRLALLFRQSQNVRMDLCLLSADKVLYMRPTRSASGGTELTRDTESVDRLPKSLLQWYWRGGSRKLSDAFHKMLRGRVPGELGQLARFESVRPPADAPDDDPMRPAMLRFVCQPLPRLPSTLPTPLGAPQPTHTVLTHFCDARVLRPPYDGQALLSFCGILGWPAHALQTAASLMLWELGFPTNATSLRFQLVLGLVGLGAPRYEPATDSVYVTLAFQEKDEGINLMLPLGYSFKTQQLVLWDNSGPGASLLPATADTSTLPAALGSLLASRPLLRDFRDLLPSLETLSKGNNNGRQRTRNLPAPMNLS